MPVGILTDVSATVIGGILGLLLGSRLSDRWKSLLNNMLGIAAIVIGIVLIPRVHTLSAVVLAMILGALCGEALKLEERVNAVVTKRCYLRKAGRHTGSHFRRYDRLRARLKAAHGCGGRFVGQCAEGFCDRKLLGSRHDHEYGLSGIPRGTGSVRGVTHLSVDVK